MVKVDFGSGADGEEYRNCTTQPDCVSPKSDHVPTLLRANDNDRIHFAQREPQPLNTSQNAFYQPTNEYRISVDGRPIKGRR